MDYIPEPKKDNKNDKKNKSCDNNQDAGNVLNNIGQNINKSYQLKNKGWTKRWKTGPNRFLELKWKWKPTTYRRRSSS